MVNYFQCKGCNYQFLTTDDSHCRKCGKANANYLKSIENTEGVLNFITLLTANFNAQLKELSHRIDKIENELNAHQ